jgi:N-acetylmuramoyl-L-alanine amidase CwlA
MPSYLLKDSQNINNRTFKYWLNKPNSTDKHDLLVYVKSSMLSIELIQTNGSKMLINCKDDVTVTLVSNNELKLTSSEKTEFFTCWRNTTDSKQKCKSIETTEITLYFKPNNDNNNFEYL